MVLTVHVRGYLEGIPTIISKLFSIGAYGVALYFIISGYLSYKSVLNCSSFTQYLRKKIIRIFPMYYVSLLVTFIIGAVILKIYPIDWKWIYHILFLNMFVPNKEWMWWNSVNFFWTMPAFVAWYLLSYPLFKKMTNSTTTAISSLIVSILTPDLKRIMNMFASEQFVNWNFFCLLYVFLFGSLAYFIIKEKKHVIGFAYGFLIGIIGWFCENRSGFFVFGIVFYFLLLLVDLCPIKWTNKKINQTIRWLSAISYSTYLTHWFILTLCGNMLKMLPWMFAYLLFIVISVILGGFCYKFIEKPVTNLIVRYCGILKLSLHCGLKK